MARAKKFGAFAGVFTPSILTILGVIMYLRLPWITGYAGLWTTLSIILVAHIISVSTGLSVSSVATDKRVGTGGVYYIISRSLGLPIGGTLGLALFVGFSFSISLYLIGFSETFLGFFGYQVSLNAIRITGSITLIIATIITLISTSLAIKTQYLIMGAIVLSLVSVLFGTHEFVPYTPQLDAFGRSLSWIALFAIFFPAVTGFTAGVSMSGDLKDPRKDIPLGTMTAIGAGLVVYIGLAVFFAFTVDRVSLVENPNILFEISWVPQLVVFGILGATLSSAIGSILGAPRIMQAISNDRILPPFFGKGYGPSKNPRNALIFTFIIAQAGILIGELNVLARLVSIFFIIAYGFLNITYAIESWASSDFRPSFKIPRVVSIVGALACIIVMIQLDVLAMIGASVILIFIFLFLKRKELTLQTGDTWNSVWASLVKTGLGKLATSSRKPRNWRPNVILFSGGERARPYLIEMGRSLVGNLGIFTNFELVENPSNEVLLRKDEQVFSEEKNQKQNVFTRKHYCADIYEGIDSISRVYGFSGFEPNTILMGWGRRTRDPERFAMLVDNFKKLDYNTVFLHFDRNAGFGKYRQIDFWWNGKGRNLSLALTLIRFITSSNNWRQTRVRILFINRDSSLTEKYYRLLNQLLENNRMVAEVKIINNGVEQLPEKTIIHTESAETDLTVLELPEASRRDPQLVISSTNHLIENLKTCLIIKASTSFEEIILPAVKEKAREKDEEESLEPVPGVMQTLKISSKELIANEVQNVAVPYTHHTERFFRDIFDPVKNKYSEFYNNLLEFSSLTLNNLQNACSIENVQDQRKEILRLLNDFSFYSRRQLTFLKEQLTPLEKDAFQQALSQYLSVLRHSVSVVPEKIRLKLPGKAFRYTSDDTINVRVYKTYKMLQAAITRKPVVHKINVSTAACYYLFYRRLLKVRELLTDFSIHSFKEVAAVRKLLSELHEIIEISRRISTKRYKTMEKIKMEKNRMLVKIPVMEKETNDFFFSQGNLLYDSLRDDLQNFNDYLDGPGTNQGSKEFKVYEKNLQELQEEIEDFPDNWQYNIELFSNRIILDFIILSLKNRIVAKVDKYKEEMKLEIESALLKPMRTYKMEEKDGHLVVPDQPRGHKLDFNLLKNPDLPAFFAPLYDEINKLVAELPETFSISYPAMIEKVEQGSQEQGEANVFNLRKTAGSYLSSELFDKTRNAVDQGHKQILRTIQTLKDLIRLVNFNLENDPDLNAEIGQQERLQHNMEVMRSFHQRMREEQAELIRLYRNIERSFYEGITSSFDSLESLIMDKKDAGIKRKMPEKTRKWLFAGINENINSLRLRTQQQFVNLLYSKSEGQLWVNRFEGDQEVKQVSNQDFISFAEALSPTPEIVKELPFYYSSLFSGQSGVGEEFWVGMEDEIKTGDLAISRYKRGVPGAIIVTGARRSGKSSLCKLLTRKHFLPENIYSLRAPRAGSSDVNEFSSSFLDLLAVKNPNLEDVLRAMAPGKVIIINDLELWWERKPGGMAVINLLRKLIERFGNKCLFVINCNIHAFNLMDKAADLRSYALATIVCRPFDAREIREMIMLRHQAGGLRFVLANKEESRMSAWDYARLFNYFFDLSGGNPGSAITLWLASIKKVEGKTILMDKISLPSEDVLDQLNQDQLFLILQFVFHRRLSVIQLAEALQRPYQDTMSEIQKLLRAGILIERFEGIYIINRNIDHHIVGKLKSLNLL